MDSTPTPNFQILPKMNIDQFIIILTNVPSSQKIQKKFQSIQLQIENKEEPKPKPQIQKIIEP